MVVIDEVIPERALFWSHQLEGGCAVLLKGALQGGGGEQGNTNKVRRLQVILGPQPRRKLDESFFFQAEQQVPRCLFLELAIGLHPVPGFTDLPGDRGTAFLVKLANDRLNEINLLEFQIPRSVAENDRIHNVLPGSGERYTTLSILTPVFFYSFFKELFPKR